MDLKLLFVFSALAVAGCKPQTATQKIEDKMEDAGHEMKQGAERANENLGNK